MANNIARIRYSKREFYNIIQEITNTMNNSSYYDDRYIIGFTTALTLLANSKGSFKDRLKSLVD